MDRSDQIAEAVRRIAAAHIERRGRPPEISRKKLEEYAAIHPGLSERSYVNMFYQEVATTFLTQEGSTIKAFGIFFNPKKCGVLEQIGRMIYSFDAIMYADHVFLEANKIEETLCITEKAALMLLDGKSVKETEKYIRQARLTGKT